MRRTTKWLCLGLLLFVRPLLAAQMEPLDACLSRLVLEAADHQSVGELRRQCKTLLNSASAAVGSRPSGADEAALTPLKRRQLIETLTEYEPFVLTPHKTNYMLFAAYNTASPNTGPFTEQLADAALSWDHVEAKFQLSLKFPLMEDLVGDDGYLYMAYTNRSFWQVYNKEASAPFRETNHEPEAWIRFRPGWNLFGFRNVINDIGIAHQSNGRSGILSRSWNRLYAQAIFQKDDFYLAFKPWWRIPEEADEDDNPEIDDYLGNFELGGLYQMERHSITVMLRNNLRYDDNRGAIQVDWSFPFTKRLRGYVQWFSGYGESLIDYNASVNSIGLGLLLTDWL
jgi:phospholipase A1